MTPKISIAATTGLLEAITDAGGNPDQILRELGLERSALTNPEGFISASILVRFLEQAAQATADDCLGLHFGERYNPKNIGPLIYVALNSPTIGAGIENVERYLKVHNEAAKWFTTVEGGRAYVRHELADLGIEAPRQYNEASMTIALSMLRMMAGSHWTPQEIQFAHAAPHRTSEHTRIFTAPVLFGCATNAFVIDREFLERQVPAADQRLYGILKRYLDGILSEMPREDGFLASIRKALGDAKGWRPEA
jgi:AraC-type transcriptional regulator